MAPFDPATRESLLAFLDEQLGREPVTPGTLYIVGTPIGNLGDLTPRALTILATYTRVAAEDTRRSGQLLHLLGLRKPLISYHEHNRASRGPELVQALRDGESIALVSDAGMPGISDPGEELVALCRAADLPVVVIPGPSAAVAALAISGLPSEQFVFRGFLPSHGKSRKDALRDLQAAVTLAQTQGGTCSFILYEAPHRLLKTLEDLVETGLGASPAAILRELTKRHEDYHAGTVEALLLQVREEAPRGEIVLILAPAASAARPADANAVDSEQWWNGEIDARLAVGARPSAIVRELLELPRPAGVSALTRNELYARVMDRRDRRPTSL